MPDFVPWLLFFLTAGALIVSLLVLREYRLLQDAMEDLVAAKDELIASMSEHRDAQEALIVKQKAMIELLESRLGFQLLLTSLYRRSLTRD